MNVPGPVGQLLKNPLQHLALDTWQLEAGAIATNAWMLFIFNRPQGPMSMSFSEGVGLGVMETEKAVLMQFYFFYL